MSSQSGHRLDATLPTRTRMNLYNILNGGALDPRPETGPHVRGWLGGGGVPDYSVEHRWRASSRGPITQLTPIIRIVDPGTTVYRGSRGVAASNSCVNGSNETVWGGVPNRMWRPGQAPGGRRPGLPGLMTAARDDLGRGPKSDVGGIAPLLAHGFDRTGAAAC